MTLIGFQLELYTVHCRDDYIIAVVALVGVDPDLVDDLKVVFALVLGVDQGAFER